MTTTVLETARPEHTASTRDPVTAPEPLGSPPRSDAVDWWQLLGALPATDEDELPLFGRLVA